jgi:hypothetical protein
MPDPLPSDVVARLKSDPMAALAAALIVAGSFPDLVSWAMKAFGGKDGVPLSETKPPSSVSRRAGRSNAPAKRDEASVRARSNGANASPAVAAKHDEALLALMRANPGALNRNHPYERPAAQFDCVVT